MDKKNKLTPEEIKAIKTTREKAVKDGKIVSK